MDNKNLVIPAECHSDDHAVQVAFDALPWFQSATDAQIEAVARDEWGPESTTDAIALFMESKCERVRFMFEYVHVRNQIEDIGYGCTVDGEKALAWLKDNRSSAYELINRD
jgi:hypothetical protein